MPIKIWRRIFNGKKHGNVKEYFSEGKLSFEGEYLNGKKNGIGKEYNINGKLRFEGEYLDGKIKKNISSCINFWISLRIN